jgi:hypothetical protein
MPKFQTFAGIFIHALICSFKEVLYHLISVIFKRFPSFLLHLLRTLGFCESLNVCENG